MPRSRPILDLLGLGLDPSVPIWQVSSGGDSLKRMNGSDHTPTLTDSRYRTLLDVSRAMIEQPTVKAVVHSFRGVLSSSCRLHGAHLYVLGSEGEILHLIEFDREADAPAIKIGTKIFHVGVVARVLEDLEPAFLPD